MKEKEKTKKELMGELLELREQVALLKESESRFRKAKDRIKL